jgi:hypothetical protein
MKTSQTSKTTALITLTVLSTLAPLAAANPSADPKLPKEVQAMHCVVGTWSAKAAPIVMDGKKTKADISITCAPASGGWAISCNGVFKIDGMGTAEESDIFGYDPEQKLYHWYAVTSMGETHDHVAMPPTSDSAPIVFAHSGFSNGMPMQEVLRMQFNKDATKMDFRNTTVVAGQQTFSLVASLAKK